MSFIKKIAAFDLDGTLTESKQEISVAMTKLLAKLTCQTRVTIISGEPFKQFEKQFLSVWNKLNINRVENNLILLPVSGSQCYEYKPATGWTLTYVKNFPSKDSRLAKKTLKKIINSKKYNLPEKIWGKRVDDRGTQITFSALGQKAPLAKKILWDPDQKKRQRIKAEFEKKIGQANLEISIGGTTSIDILPKGFNKGTGLRCLAERLNLNLKDIIFIGDSLFKNGNDYLIKKTGIESIAVKSPNETKNIINKWLS
ncbi:MAG: HAD-IIB family hydrolase [Patescibacteria group bacterium]|jgi:hypothetical protein